VLVLAGFAILRWIDGQWWAVLLWVVVAPVVYLALDFFSFGRSRRGAATGGRRRQPVVDAKAGPATAARPGRAVPEWQSARPTSTGGEILRRGRRYDKRRA
jgi:hypothetical protein